MWKHIKNLIRWEGLSFVALTSTGFALLSLDKFRATEICFWLAAVSLILRFVEYAWKEIGKARVPAIIIFAVIVFSVQGLAVRPWVNRLQIEAAKTATSRTLENPETQTPFVQVPPKPTLAPSSISATKTYNKVQALSPIDGLAQLGWMVQPAEGTGLQFSDIYKNISLQKSSLYFTKLDRPFSVNIVGAKSLDGVSGLQDAKYLRKLSLVDPKLADFSGLRNLGNLESLVISQTGTLSDLSPLRDLVNLKELVLGSTAIRDLRLISGLREITTLSIQNTQISDLSPIRGFRNLRVLSLGGSRVTDLSPISDIGSLEELSIAGQQVAGLPVLRYLASLKKLSLYDFDNMPVDLAPIGDLGELENLYIDGPTALNLAPLRKLTKLRNLSLKAFGPNLSSLMQLQDMDAIGELHELRRLVLFQVLIPNLSFMRGLPNLTEFTAINSPISDITGIDQAAALNTVQFNNTSVYEISPLLNLPKLRELYVIRTPARSDELTVLEQRGVKVHAQ